MFENVLEMVGNTPVVKVNGEGLSSIELYAKLEYYNPTGSVKDRAANYIIKKLLELGEINHETTLIESSSGNFGIALASYCRKYGNKFCCVIDPNISAINETIIRKLSTTTIKVTEPDSKGGYLLRRIKKVKELLVDIPNSYWVNQYANPYNAEAYYNTLGLELCCELDRIDYIFLGVSSGGTITGVSNRIKEMHPKAKVIAVDVEGSVIFGGIPKKRTIPGIGSSMVPTILKEAKIDDVVIVDEIATIVMCHELLEKHMLFAGGSSGSVLAAIKEYFFDKIFATKPNVVAILPDRGERYANTIFNKIWCNERLKELENDQAIQSMRMKEQQII
jgi:2,3-diaminopropionate biosynthesis protein SbnA